MPDIYITIQGDMWDAIAYKALGSELYTDILIKRNLQYKDIFIFSAGISLKLPVITLKKPDGLPPWKMRA